MYRKVRNDDNRAQALEGGDDSQKNIPAGRVYEVTSLPGRAVLFNRFT